MLLDRTRHTESEHELAPLLRVGRMTSH